MKELFLEQENGLTRQQIEEAVLQVTEQFPDAKRVLIVPPDYTRCHSYAGELTRLIYKAYEGKAKIDILPGVGTHIPMSREEQIAFFGEDIPEEVYIPHDWKADVVTIGTIPSEEVSAISDGLFHNSIAIQLDRRIMENNYDVIFSTGQVVPHEAAGMANYSKSLFIGAGGQEMISALHILCSVCFTQMGERDTVMRKAFDYAQRTCIDGKLPVVYFQTVVTKKDEEPVVNGLYVGMSRKPFEAACELSQKLNIIHEDRKPKKVIAYLDPSELRSFWVGNKAIYRTRMLIAEGGELLILAPGVVSFGEVEETESAIKDFGYRGRQELLDMFKAGVFGDRTLGAGHLLLSSPDGHFKITYATKPENMSEEDVRSVFFDWMDYNEAIKKYDPETMKEGWNILPDGEEVYYVPAPALGLWAGKE